MTRSRIASTLRLSLLLSTLCSTPPAAAEQLADWSQWRGPDRDGAVSATTPWPGELSGLELAWRVPLGNGYPGPIVSGDRVFVVETVDKKTVAARALDRSTGEELWKQSWPGKGSVPFFAKANGDWVRSTPVFDGETLFFGDMSEVVRALDAETGKVRWRVDIPERFGTDAPDFGFASSPLIDGEFLYLQAANSLVKLDKKSGETVWRKLNHSGAIGASGAFSSPTLATIGGVRQLVVQTRHELYGVDPDAGEILWSEQVPSFRGMNILTPLVSGNTIFTSPYKQRSFLYEVERTDDGFAVSEAWTNKSTAYMSSPIVIDGHAYVHLANGRLECIDLESGASRWRSEPLGKYWSMAHHDGRILALSNDGTLRLLQADPAELKLLDSKKVADQDTWGHVAVSGKMVFVRELEGVSAWRFAD